MLHVARQGGFEQGLSMNCTRIKAFGYPYIKTPFLYVLIKAKHEETYMGS